MMTPTQAFHAYCDAFGRRDHAAMAELFTEDGTFEAPTLDNPLQGKTELQSQLRIISSALKGTQT